MAAHDRHAAIDYQRLSCAIRARASIHTGMPAPTSELSPSRRLQAIRLSATIDTAAVGVDQSAWDPRAGGQRIGIDEDFAPGRLDCVHINIAQFCSGANQVMILAVSAAETSNPVIYLGLVATAQ